MKTLISGAALSALLFPIEANAEDNPPAPHYNIEHDCGTDVLDAPPIAQACTKMEYYSSGQLSKLELAGHLTRCEERLHRRR